jgi:hypothetical protein
MNVSLQNAAECRLVVGSSGLQLRVSIKLGNLFIFTDMRGQTWD